MKKKILSIMAVISMFTLAACGTKTEVTPAPVENNESNAGNEVVESVVDTTPQKTEEKVAKESLILGGEWKPTTGYYFESGENDIVEYSIESIYGKYAGVGGATFHEDGTFTKFVGI